MKKVNKNTHKTILSVPQESMINSLELFKTTHTQACYGCNATGIGIISYKISENSIFSTTSHLITSQGAEGILHGGILATMIDESMAQIVNQEFESSEIYLTKNITIRYLKLLPINSKIALYTRRTKIENEKYEVKTIISVLNLNEDINNKLITKFINEIKNNKYAVAKGVFVRYRS